MIRSKEKRVIVYGVGGSLREALEYIELRFDIVAFSDSDNSKASAPIIKNYVFVSADSIHKLEYDYILICSIHDHEIKEQLVAENGLDEERILIREQWQRMPVRFSFGELNPELTFYVIAKPIRARNGIISIVYSTIKQLNEIEPAGYIPVADMQNHRNQYLPEEKYKIDNSWEYYFEPLSPYSLEEVYNSKNVILGYDSPDYLYGYEEWLDIPGLQRMYRKYIRIKPNVKEKIQCEYHKIFYSAQKVLGVVYRGTDYNNLKLKHHLIQPDIEEIAALIKMYVEKNGFDKIFISTEDAYALRVLKEKFGEALLYTNQMRFENTGNQWLADISFDRENDCMLRGLEYLTTIMLLTKCDGLIGGMCAASVFAHIAGYDKFEVIDIFKKGVY